MIYSNHLLRYLKGPIHSLRSSSFPLQAATKHCLLSGVVILLVACGGGGGGSSSSPSTSGSNELSGQVQVRPHETYALLEWSLPQEDQGEISEIRIEIRQAGRVVDEIVVAVTTTQWRVEDLVEGEGYVFQVVFTFSDGETGSLSSGAEEIKTGSNLDNDGLIDELDDDKDGDGVENEADAFPEDRTETMDTDGDGTGNNADAFPNDATETTDTDGDGTGDNADEFPNDPTETMDTDGDGTGNNADAFPMDPMEDTDTDGDGTGDNADAFPNDPTETMDTDGDGTGDNADAFPMDPMEDTDTDGDGTGNNADTDDDNDGIEDIAEERMRNRRGQSCSLLADCDGDDVDDGADLDIDGDHLIEVRTQRELDAMRFVLDGSGQRFSDTGQINTSGCADCRGYELLNDIVLSVADPKGWKPIGENLALFVDRGLGIAGNPIENQPPDALTVVYCDGDGFSGILEGNGWTIANLTIDRYKYRERGADREEDCVGFFGQLSGEVRNLRIEAHRVRGYSNVGILAGSGRSAKVSSVHVGRYIDAASIAEHVPSGKDVDGLYVFGNATVGGLMGSMFYGSIIDSSVQTDVLESDAYQLGGLVGLTVETTIHNSAALNGDIASGFAGINFIGTNHNTGGLVGYCVNTEFDRSFAISEHIETIDPRRRRNGNFNRQNDDQMIGGFAGRCSKLIENSYALTGTIDAYTNVGGLVGQDGGGHEDGNPTRIRHSYAMTEQVGNGKGRVVNGKLQGNAVGGLVGYFADNDGANAYHSLYAITGTILGTGSVGGLGGEFDVGSRLSSSYALSGTIRGNHSGVGGLLGGIDDISVLGVVSSYAVTHSLEGSSQVGGLFGSFDRYQIFNIRGSYAMVANLTASAKPGGLVGGEIGKPPDGPIGPISVEASYAVANGSDVPSDLIGADQDVHMFAASYMDNLTDADRTQFLQGTGLEEDWRNRSLVGDRSIWCDRNGNNRIDRDEADPSSGIYVWDFGKVDQYPHIQCTPPIQSGFGLQTESWRSLVGGKLDIPNTEELTQRIRDFRAKRREAFLGKLIIPYEDAILLRWYHPRPGDGNVMNITIEVDQAGEMVRRILLTDNDIRLSAYRVEDLVSGESYAFEVIFSYDDNSTARLHSDGEVFVGANRDQDGLIDALDLDDDNDGLMDMHPKERQVNSDGISCSLLADCDDDTIGDKEDNCPVLVNRDQLDTDGDDVGDVCDDDKDGDGVANTDEEAGCDLLVDCDGDRLLDGDPAERLANAKGVSCSLLVDCDNDTINDNSDNCPVLVNKDQLNTDGDGTGDECDADKDGDGVANADEEAGCDLLVDCDGDHLLDNESTERLANAEGISCSLLVDCDGDRLLDNESTERLVNMDGESCSVLQDCDGDRLLDNDSTERLANAAGISCSLLADCDNDTLMDDESTEQLANAKGISCSVLTDCDNDTLTDNESTEQLANAKGISCSVLADCDNDTLTDNESTERLENPDGESCSLLTDCDGDSLTDDELTEQLKNVNGVSCSVLTDCDEDELTDDHPTERMMNSNGVSCSLLADCDEDGTLDRDDAHPTDPLQS